MVVVSVDFRVAVVSPVGAMVVPLEVDPLLLTVTPFTLVVFSLLVWVETTGGGMTGVVVVDCVVVELDEELCAKAPPVMSVTANVAANNDLIISNISRRWGGSGIARLTGVIGGSVGFSAESRETTHPLS